MLIRKDAHCLLRATVLRLPRDFLHLFVRNLKDRQVMADGNTETIAIAKIPVHTAIKTCRAGVVGEVFEHRWVQVAIGQCSVNSAANRGFFPAILYRQIANHASETSARRRKFSMQASPGVLRSRY